MHCTQWTKLIQYKSTVILPLLVKFLNDANTQVIGNTVIFCNFYFARKIFILHEKFLVARTRFFYFRKNLLLCFFGWIGINDEFCRRRFFFFSNRRHCDGRIIIFLIVRCVFFCRFEKHAKRPFLYCWSKGFSRRVRSRAIIFFFARIVITNVLDWAIRRWRGFCGKIFVRADKRLLFCKCVVCRSVRSLVSLTNGWRPVFFLLVFTLHYERQFCCCWKFFRGNERVFDVE